MGDQIRSVRVRLSAENASYIASMRASGAETKKTAKEMDNAGGSARKLDSDLDRVSGRAKILAQTLATLGPAAIPLTATVLPGITGLANQAGFAAVGLGTTVLALQGVKDALKAVTKYDLDPTAENLKAVRLEMAQLSPDAQRFVLQLRDMVPELKSIRDTAAHGLLPGLGQGLGSLETILPRVEAGVGGVASKLGEISARSGASLASDRWVPFLDFVGRKAPQELDVMSTAIGNTVHGLAGLWMATEPLNNDFDGWLVRTTARFDKWANTLDSNQSFQELMTYIRQNGPQAEATLGAIGNAFLQIIEAAAPLGGPTLKILEHLADLIASIADSPVGTPLLSIISAVSALKLVTNGLGGAQRGAFGAGATGQMKSYELGWSGIRKEVTAAKVALNEAKAAQAVGRVTVRDSMSALIPASGKRQAIVDYNSLIGQTATAEERLSSARRNVASSAIAVGGLALATSGLADKLGASNTVMLAAAGAASPLGIYGAAIGAVAGGVLDLAKAFDNSDERAAKFAKNLQSIVAAAGPNLTDQLAAVDKQISDIGTRDYAVDKYAEGHGTTKDFAKKALTLNPDLQGRLTSSDLKTAKAARDQLTDAIKQQDIATAMAAETDARATNELSKLGYAGIITQKSLDALTQSMINQKNSANSAFSAETNYRQALKDARAQADKNNAGIRGNSAAVIANRNALSGLSGAWNNQSDAVKNNVKRYRAARQNFIDVATAMGVPLSRARQLANQLLQIPKKVLVDVTINGHNTVDELAQINRMVRQIPRKWQTDYYVNQVNSVNKHAGGGKDGDPGTPYAGGGYTGPGGRWDPAGVVHRGEVVWSQDDVAAHGGPAQVDAMRQARGPGYADGGQAGLPWGVRAPTPPLGAGLPWGIGAQTPSLGDYLHNDLDLKFPKTLKQWQKALEKSTKAIDKERSSRDDLVSKRTDLQNTIVNGLRQDPFSTDRPDGWQWMAGADRQRYLTQNPLNVLNQNAANGQAYTAAEKTLASKHLDGRAFEQLVSTGDLERVQAFAGLSAAQLATYETAVKKSDAFTFGAGKFGAGVVYNAQIDTTNAHLSEMVKQGAALGRKVDAVEKAIHAHAAKEKASKRAAGASVRTKKRVP